MTEFTDIQKARAQVLLTDPFFATILMSMPLEVDNSRKTAATDMKTIFYNEAFIASLSIPEIKTVLVHEMIHAMFKHGLRRGGRHPLVWNWAGDYAINIILRDSKFVPLTRIGWLYDDQYRGMSVEQIYDLIVDDDGSSRDRNGLGEDVLDPAGGTAEERAAVEYEMDQKIAAAVNQARLAGNLPAGLERFVGELLNPVAPWPELLRRFMTKPYRVNETWGRRNMRIQHAYLPSRRGRRMGELVYIGDTSGSISNDDLKTVAAEVGAIAETVRPERIRLVWWDAAFQGEQTFEPGQPIDAKPKGGGGTDMVEALKYVEQFDPIAVVLHTDGYTPWPRQEPLFPLIVVCTTQTQVPFGDVVRI